MTTPASVARFDDLISGRALLFGRPHRVLSAETLDSVLPVLHRVQHATEAGRWVVGYLAYEAAAAFLPGRGGERIDQSAGGSPLPLAWFAEVDPPAAIPALEGIPDTDHRLDGWQLDWSPEQHAAAVRQVHRAIEAGTTYQANLTTMLRGRLSGDPLSLYRELAVSQSGAFNAFLDLGGAAVVSASPERFVRWSDRELRCSPMKGTRARGRTPEEDDRLRAELLASAKDRAENVMIVDLLRNDLTRIAEPGTVRVSELMRLECYPSVWQLTSDVTARPRAGLTVAELLAALFPCGSITGAPKLSTIRLLRELEAGPRGVYCGAIGYLAPPASPVRGEFSVPIRTCVVGPGDLEPEAAGEARQPPAWRPVEYGVGGGITYSSDASGEYDEMVAKTAVLRGRPPAPFRLLETFGVGPDGVAAALPAHLDRLQRSARHFGFRWDRPSLEAGLRARLRTPAGHPPRRARLLLDRDGIWELELAPMPEADHAPVRVVVDTEASVDPASVWVHHKTTQRALYEAARRRHPQAGEVLLVNTAGLITEATTATVLARLDGQWCTPPLSDGCLPGIARADLLAAGRVRERSLTPEQLRSAEAVRLVNSLRGIRPAELA